MADSIHVRLTREPLDIAAVSADVLTAKDGAVCTFTGHVRDRSAGSEVTALDYEVYDAMALNEMRRIAGQAVTATAASAIALEHRVGRVPAGEASVVVAAAAPHRNAAFDACRRVVEAVKADVPIWKRELGPDGVALTYEASPALAHIGPSGEARMVDVSAKPETERFAVAAGTVRCDAATARLIATGSAAKGDVLATARTAGVMAAKQTSALIPMCHPLALAHVEVNLVVDESLPGVRIEAAVRCFGRTGVEMEALTAVTVAALTVVDMAKSSDRWMTLEGVGLVRKEGGRHGPLARPGIPSAAAQTGGAE